MLVPHLGVLRRLGLRPCGRVLRDIVILDHGQPTGRRWRDESVAAQGAVVAASCWKGVDVARVRARPAALARLMADWTGQERPRVIAGGRLPGEDRGARRLGSR